MMPIRLSAIPIAIAAACLLPGAAAASTTMESIFEDDFQILSLGPSEQSRALDDFDRLGADVVRSLVYWNRLARKPRSKKRPRGFRAQDPAAYRARDWDRYDDLVRGAGARGMAVLLSPSSPMPAWASQCKGSAKKRRTCKPRPRDYGRFLQALGTRYSGTYADENQGRGILPRVDRWSFWNEPNQPGWLMPQYSLRNGRRVAFAAHRYRALVRAGAAGLRRSGHGSDLRLLGETAPIGRTSGSLARRPIPPVDFIRELLCLTRSGKRQRGATARASGCTRPGRLAVNAYAHHPYTRGGSQPPRSRVLPGEITISTASRLKRMLTQGARAGRIPAGMPIHYTEFGYQTNPPDRLFGVTLEEQATYLNESDWIAYRDGRVKSVAQYKLVDEPELASFQTGLKFVNGTAKPAWDAYRLPLWVSRAGSAEARVYGQVRPAEDNALELVELQHRPGRNSAFTTVQVIEVTSPKGHFLVSTPARAGQWRLRWAPSAGGPVVLSRVAGTAKR